MSTAWNRIAERPLVVTFAVAIAVRAAAGLLLVVTGLDSSAAMDDDTYARMAAAVVQGQTDGWDGYTTSLYNGTAGFMLPLTAVFSVLGVNSYSGPLLAGLFGAMAAVLTARLVLQALGRRWALAAGFGVALLPSQVLWSSLTLKDSAVWAATLLLANVAAAVVRARGWRLAVQCSAALGTLVWLGHLRVPTFVVACWALAIVAVVLPGPQRLLRAAACVALLLAVPYQLGFDVAGLRVASASSAEIQQRRMWNAFGAASAFLSTEELPQEQAVALTEELAAVRAERAELEQAVANAATSNTATSNTATSNTDGAEGSDALEEQRRRLALVIEQEAQLNRDIADIYLLSGDESDDALERNVAHLPKGLAVMLVEPLPWQAAPTAAVKSAKAETLVLYPLLGFAALGLVASRRHLRTLLFPLLAGGAVLLSYALTEGNFGTAYRHRAEIGPVLILLATFGAERTWSWSRTRRGSPAH